MTVQAAVGTISILSTDAVNTTKVISCGFQPKAIIFWCTGQGSATDAVTNQTARYAMGVASWSTS